MSSTLRDGYRNVYNKVQSCSISFCWGHWHPHRVAEEIPTCLWKSYSRKVSDDCFSCLSWFSNVMCVLIHLFHKCFMLTGCRAMISFSQSDWFNIKFDLSPSFVYLSYSSVKMSHLSRLHTRLWLSFIFHRGTWQADSTCVPLLSVFSQREYFFLT